MSIIKSMSPFWKNVNDELLYQGMNFKTLAYITGIPYTTLTNGKNRADSIPSADVALKISRALNKPLERLLGTDADFFTNDSNTDEKTRNAQLMHLYKKYENLISDLEKCTPAVQDSFCRMAQAVCNQR